MGHNYSGSWTTTSYPTCTSSGQERIYCTRCGYVYSTIAAYGHSYSANTYQWSEDCGECTVGFVCSRDSSHTGTVTVASTSATSGNATTYSVSGTDSTYGASYSSTKTLYTYTATLEYDVGDGTGAPSAQSVTVAIESSTASGSETFSIPTDVPSLSGFEFLGWATTEGASEAGYQPGEAISVPYGSTVTLHAVWAASAIEITSDPSSKTLIVGQTWRYVPEMNVPGCVIAVSGVEWLTVGEDGGISGEPTAPGTYEITITASKDGYEGAEQTLQLKVYSVLGFESEPSASGVFAYAS